MYMGVNLCAICMSGACGRLKECAESPNNRLSGNWSCSVGSGELNPDLLEVQPVF